MKRVLAIVLVAVGVVVALGIQGKEGSGYRVQAIFDTAAFVVPGEDVKIAGVRVGKINQLRVTPDNKAAVEMTITEPGYQDFRDDATCSIRPQSLIGEQFIECALTQPREPGAPPAPPLAENEDGVAELPVSQTRTSVALDLVGNVNRLPVRQRLSLILNELGVALAGRGEDLNEVIRRAAPALEETNEVLKLIADQNEVLDQLAVDSDRILAPLADERKSLTSFVSKSSDVAEATVERQAQLAQNFEKLPLFLEEIQPTMDRLVEFSDETIPVANNLLAGAQDINELIERTGPFSRAATPALTRLGAVGKPGIPALRASLPIVKDLREFGVQLQPVAKDLAALLGSFEKNDGIERLMDYVYFQVQAINGFDNFGHFLRAGLIVNTCSTYSTTPAAECQSKFSTSTSTRSGATPTGNETIDNTQRVLAGEDPDAVISEAEQDKIREATAQFLEPAEKDESAAPSTTDDLLDFLLGLTDEAVRLEPLANPVLIGAVTTLVIIVAVFLSYNANSGLPFVPTYDIKVDVPTAANLVKGNEVRIGGARVGAISDISPKTLDDGTTIATLDLKLDMAVDPLPDDSTIVVRPKSLLGLKYLEITRGDSENGYSAGDTVPASASRVAEVEFDELIDTFDAPTRLGIADSTIGIGTALSGRGESLNSAIGSLRPLLTDLLPVARYLRDPETGLTNFIRALGQAAAEVAPVADSQASLFVGLSSTFSSLAEVARPFIQDTIAEGPETLDTAVDSFRVQRPFLENTAGLMRDLSPGVDSLVDAAPVLSDALQIGRPVLKRTPAFDRRLEDLLVSLEDFATDDVVPQGVADLTETTATLRPTLNFLEPAQTTCNYVANWFRNVSDLLTVGDSSGTTQRFIIIATPQGPNNEGGPSSAAASGPLDENYLHMNPYPNTASPGQPKECEAGNEPYIAGQTQIGNAPGLQQASTDGTP